MQAVELFPHQLKAVEELHNGCILCGGVGAGKSRVAMRYYIKREAPKDVYVITTAKKRDSLDWEAEAILHGVGTETSVPVAGSTPGLLHVDSWNNLAKYINIEGAFFIFDEQRLVGSGAWVKSFYKIAKRNNWIMLSATPGDTWLDYIPVMVANGYYKNRAEFLREHVVYKPFIKYPKIDRYIGVNRLVRQRNALLVDMPYERHTTRVINEITVEYDEDLFKRVVNDRWHVYENRPLKDVGELYSVMRKVVNSNPSRLSQVQDLISTHKKVIVFYCFDYELEILRKGLGSFSSQELLVQTRLESDSINLTLKESRTSSLRQSEQLSQHEKHQRASSLTSSDTKTSETLTDVCVAEWNGHKHEEIPKTDSWVYLVQYRAGAEGWNCVETDTIVFYSLTYSYRDFHQAQGRIDRLNTSFSILNYYVLKSTSYIDKVIWKSLSIKQNFNEKRDSQKILAKVA